MVKSRKLTNKTCVICSSSYVSKRSDSKYCSRSCSDKGCNRVRFKPIICSGCGKEFVAKRSGRVRYCTKKCGHIYRNKTRYGKWVAYRYGVSPECRQEMERLQGGVCYLCGETNKNGKRLFVDHNHETGQVRNLLCTRCNAGIGMFDENISLIEKAADYLRNWSKKESMELKNATVGK